MLFEAQALDLYMRHLDLVPNQDAANILHQLVKEEKNHLRILAGLMRKDIIDENRQGTAFPARFKE
jgi:rubrerythrin